MCLLLLKYTVCDVFVAVEIYSVMCLLLLHFSASFYVTWGARSDSAGGVGAPLPPFGRPLGKLSADDLESTIEKGLKLYSKLSLTSLYLLASGQGSIMVVP